MHQPLKLFSLLLVLLLGGCAAPLRLPPEVTGLPERVELVEVPFFPQQEYQCGPAALATMLGQREIMTTPGQLKERVFLPGRQGSLQVELVAAARQHGMLVYPLDAQLDAILAEVAAGNPVLVLQNLAFSWYPRWHFAVIVGYDRAEQQLILRSGITKRWITDFASFDATWARGGRWAVLTLPPDTLPARVQLQPWLQAAADLEQTAQMDAASQAYASAVQRWPQDGLAWFALGNARYAMADTRTAQAAFLRSLELEPSLAPGWSNLAHVLAEHGCAAQAEQALRCARVLAPDEARFLRSLPTQGHSSALCAALPACPRG
jgi:tetratricopeptide (TPR) repeat protein